MRSRFLVIVAAGAVSLALAGSAAAFDCIRVASSLQGLQASTRSGNWLLLDFSTAEATRATVTGAFGTPITLEQAACLTEGYGGSGTPAFFALGVDVAGPNGVLAHRNPNLRVLSDLRGVDHFEDAGILEALLAAAAECGIPTG